MTEFQQFLRKLPNCRLEQEIESAERGVAEALAETAWTAAARARNLSGAEALLDILQAERDRRLAA
jgi:hypothetical protein